jgi:hypothetical protein
VADSGRRLPLPAIMVVFLIVVVPGVVTPANCRDHGFSMIPEQCVVWDLGWELR